MVPVKLIIEIVGMVCALIAAIVAIVILAVKVPAINDRLNAVEIAAKEKINKEKGVTGSSDETSGGETGGEGSGETSGEGKSTFCLFNCVDKEKQQEKKKSGGCIYGCK